jgi:hypothetical protein
VLYRYLGTEPRTFPDVPVTPAPGDVVDWRDLVPDPGFWEPAPKVKAKNVRPNDNALAPADDSAPPVSWPQPPAASPDDNASMSTPESAGERAAQALSVLKKAAGGAQVGDTATSPPTPPDATADVPASDPQE